MAIDNKYGRVALEFGDIGKDEPVFVFRAQDKLLIPTLESYFDMCEEADRPVRHLDKIREAMYTIKRWQASNFTKLPESKPQQM